MPGSPSKLGGALIVAFSAAFFAIIFLSAWLFCKRGDFLSGKNPPNVSQTQATHLGPSELAPRGEVEFDYFSLPNQDGNSVDMDHEMSKLAENQLLYRATTKVYTKRMALIKYAIQEGG